ncbi:MAG: hypothetical protein K0U24_03935 [Gammaproteobacteria bacterium]|nr:hypothetical protein [Gammaproteobacteria bacterium]MCH9763366.1 hypothetical protein [Gammaproteobacteria bacterium]
MPNQKDQTPNHNNSEAASSTTQEKPKRSAFSRWPTLKKSPTELTDTGYSSAHISALLTPGAAASDANTVSQKELDTVIALQRKFRATHPSTTTTSSAEEHKNDDKVDLETPVAPETAPPSPRAAAVIQPHQDNGGIDSNPLVASETVVPEAVTSAAISPPPSPRVDTVRSPEVVLPDLPRANNAVKPPMSEEEAFEKIKSFRARNQMSVRPKLEKRMALKQNLHKLLTNNLDDLTSVLKTKLVSDQYEAKVKEIYDSILVEIEPLAKKASKEKLDSFKAWFDGMMESHKNSFPEKNWIWHNYVKKALSTLLGVIVVAATLVARPFVAGVAEYAGSFFETPETSGFKMFKESALKAKATAEVDVENTISTLPALGA